MTFVYHGRGNKGVSQFVGVGGGLYCQPRWEVEMSRGDNATVGAWYESNVIHPEPDSFPTRD